MMSTVDLGRYYRRLQAARRRVARLEHELAEASREVAALQGRVNALKVPERAGR